MNERNIALEKVHLVLVGSIVVQNNVGIVCRTASLTGCEFHLRFAEFCPYAGHCMFRWAKAERGCKKDLAEWMKHFRSTDRVETLGAEGQGIILMEHRGGE